ncbi:MAG: methionine--tRNA ligase subunit beta [Promethearchaeota archaeon]
MTEKKKVSYEDFKKLDIRIGLVRKAEKVPDSRALIKLMVDLGEEKPRQIIAGVSKFYGPEKLIDRRIVVLANLQPRKLMGLESNGMLLAADVDNKPYLLKVPDKFSQQIPPGTKVT